MARLNISVPDELKARMDDINTNWSAIASEAFELEVRKRERIVEMNHAQIAGRLKASYQQEAAKYFDKGHENGAKWAALEADAAELMFLENRTSSADGGQFLRRGDYEDTPFEEYGDVETFLEVVLSISDGTVNLPAPIWFEGFVAGALEVWASVKEEVVG